MITTVAALVLSASAIAYIAGSTGDFRIFKSSRKSPLRGDLKDVTIN